MAGDDAVRAFLAEIQGNPGLDADLVDEVTRTYTEKVQHWVFPEEPGLSSGLPDAIVCTFPELVHSVHGAVGSLRRVLNMLVGVNVRLNLRGSHGAIKEALDQVMEELAYLERACEHVGSGTLLAPAFPREEAEGRPSWASPDGEPLSPKQIAWLADLGQKDPDFSVAYGDGISGHSAPPQLVTERARARERQMIRAEQNCGFEEQERKALALLCPRCGSAPGAECRSRAGKVTTMHKGRYGMVS
ncbi:hypothetical protein E2F48_11465 [Arthrobacter crusticola]|uniref:DNA-binding phage zinc finger domain-containing protein n=1 Tax=Arthrobacter crusticola TaxID=2547960 RepID=A0A4R5TXC9_9MICC|nr:hypothetical protein [Arthrobacter crusticola]TDK25835.1 hypothetical protein E2F48_11465 [Arthrobacter crusticola]